MHKQLKITAAYFGIVLGLTGIGQAWHAAHILWNLPAIVGEFIIVVAFLSWAALITSYLWQIVSNFEAIKTEFLHPVQGQHPSTNSSFDTTNFYSCHPLLYDLGMVFNNSWDYMAHDLLLVAHGRTVARREALGGHSPYNLFTGRRR